LAGEAAPGSKTRWPFSSQSISGCKIKKFIAPGQAAELSRIDEGFDHQHRMAVTNLPIAREPIQGQAYYFGCQIGHGMLWQDQKAAVVGYQAQATVPLCAVSTRSIGPGA